MKKYIIAYVLMSIANINQLNAIAVSPSSEPTVETMSAEESDIEIDKERARARGETLTEKPHGTTFKESGEPTHETMTEQEWETEKAKQIGRTRSEGRTRSATTVSPSSTIKKYKQTGRARLHSAY